MNNNDIHLTLELHEALDSLASNLSQSEPFVGYHQAMQALESDAQAKDLLQRLIQAQNDLRARQLQSMIQPSDVENLQSLQHQARANPVIMNYSEAQQKVIAYIREINLEISQLLSVDFGSLARRSSCC